MRNTRNAVGMMLAVLVLAGGGVRADWVPTAGGTYDYETPANWDGGTINNVFLSSSYSSGSQTILINADGDWNSTDAVISAHSNGTTLLLRAQDTDRSLTLGNDISFVSTGTTGNNIVQFGTVNANERINFTLSGLRAINVDSPEWGDARAIFNGVLSDSGGLSKSGDGFLYLQNGASTFTGTLEVTGGLTILAGSGATLSTENIVVGRQNEPFGYDLTYAGTQGVLVMGNNTTPAGTSSGSLGANANRIPDTATVELQGGGLRLQAQNGDDNSLTETVGTVNLTRGQGDLVVWQAATGPNNVATLHVNNLNRSTGAVLGGYGANSGGSGKGTLGTGATLESRITFTNIDGAAPSASVVNGIIPWAVNGAQLGGDYWAGTAPGDFLTYGANGLTPQTSFVSDINAAGATENVKISSTTATLSADKTINSLTLSTASLDGASALTLTAGAVNVYCSNPAGGAMFINPTLDFNGREGFIFVNNGMLLNVNSDLTNTGGNGVTITGYGSNQTRDRSTMALSPGSTYTGPTTINGVYVTAINNALPSSTALVVNEGGVLNTSWGGNPTVGSLAGYGIVGIDYNRTFHVGGDDTSTTFAGTLQEGPEGGTGSGSVTKNGTGTWTLSGTNTYGGATTVAGGGVVVDGALAAASGAVTVQSGAFLGGTGTIGRDVTVNNSGLLAAGLTNTVGTLNISSNLTLASSSILDIQLGSAGAGDKIVVGGDVTLTDSILQLSALGTLAGAQDYTIIDNQSAGAVTGTFANDDALSAGGYNLTIVYNGGDGGNDVVLSTVPMGTVVSVR